MDEISSSEFRRRYASLVEPTLVTVNGHAIGVWTPRRPVAAIYDVDSARIDLGEALFDPPSLPEKHPFNSRPFTPVPKRSGN